MTQETMVHTMDLKFKIPNGLLEKFATEAKQNISHKGNHRETLAFVTGCWGEQENEIVAKEVIFPKQRGTTTEVEDLGKYICL
jgi:hypothetical protein